MSDNESWNFKDYKDLLLKAVSCQQNDNTIWKENSPSAVYYQNTLRELHRVILYNDSAASDRIEAFSISSRGS